MARLIMPRTAWTRIENRAHIVRHLGERCELGDPAPCDAQGEPWTADTPSTHVCWDDGRLHPVNDQATVNVLAALTGPQAATLRTALLDDDPEGTPGEQARARRAGLRAAVLDHPLMKARYKAEVARLDKAEPAAPPAVEDGGGKRGR